MNNKSIPIHRGNYFPGTIYKDENGKKFVITKIVE